MILFTHPTPPTFSAAMVITPSMKLDPATGLSTISSTLQYTATKEDIGAVFACVVSHELTNQEIKLEPFQVHCKWKTAPLLGPIIVLQFLHYVSAAYSSLWKVLSGL